MREQNLDPSLSTPNNRKKWRLNPSSPMLNHDSKIIICLLSFLVSLPLAWIAIFRTTSSISHGDTLPHHESTTPAPRRSAHKRIDSMSKLSPSLKSLINAPFARPDQTAASARVLDVYKAIAGDAQKRSLGLKPWLALSSAATFTLNSPESLSLLHGVASASSSKVETAEIIREVGLKCISFNGIPRTINCLNAFRASLPADVTSHLATKPTRVVDQASVSSTARRGRGLWNSVYAPFEDKLVEKLATAHPDLPVHILGSHYGPLLSDPPAGDSGVARTGRVLTSVVAIACLRAQTGVGPQVLSHVFGLRKAFEDGSYKAEGEEVVEETEWLASDEGSEWILKSVDSIAEALGGSNFARPGGAKL